MSIQLTADDARVLAMALEHEAAALAESPHEQDKRDAERAGRLARVVRAWVK